MAKSEEKSKDLDEFLKEVGLGKWQLIQTFLLLFPTLCLMFPFSEYIFAAASIPYRCFVPECERDMENPIYKPPWISNAVPVQNGIMDTCHRFLPRIGPKLNGTEDYCPADYFDTSEKVSCDSYVYERTNTMVYDFGLECQEWKRALIGTFNSAGALISMPLIGYISDNFGRRSALITCVLSVSVIAIVRSFSVSYEMYVALQFIGAACGGALFSAIFILASEMVPPYVRVPIGLFLMTCISSGQMIAGLVAWGFPQWRDMIRVAFIPQLLFIIYFWILSESVRWLLSKEKYDRATKIMKKIIKWNRSDVSYTTVELIIDGARKKNDELKLQQKIKTQDDTENEPMLVFKILESPIMIKRMFIITVWWITLALVYYGLYINAVTLAGNIYLNYILASAAEIPGLIVGFFVLDRLGRKCTLSAACLLCSLCNFTFPFIPSDVTWLSLLIYLIGKSTSGIIVLSIYMYTAELQPTKYRHSLLAFTSMIGRIGSITAPLTPALAMYWHGIPSFIFGGMSLLSGLLTMTMPETAGLVLPDTIAEAENIGRSNVKEQFETKAKTIHKVKEFVTENVSVQLA